MRVFDRMTEHRVSPDLITFSIVLKANCDAGRLEAALELLGSIQRSGLSPDEVIVNNLLAGCAKIADPKLAKRHFHYDYINTHVLEHYSRLPKTWRFQQSCA